MCKCTLHILKGQLTDSKLLFVSVRFRDKLNTPQTGTNSQILGTRSEIDSLLL